MKCVLFYCLLAFSVFEMAFSDDLKIQLDDEYKKGGEKIHRISRTVIDQIMGDVEIAELNGISAEECYDTAEASMEKLTDNGYSQIDTCYSVAVQNKDPEYAKKCNSLASAEFEREANKLHPEVMTCIKKNTPAIY